MKAASFNIVFGIKNLVYVALLNLQLHWLK